MKNLKITFLFAFISLFLLSSQAQDCAYSTALTTLTAGDVTVSLPNNGQLWHNRDLHTSAGYTTEEVDNPNGDVGMIFAGGLWLGGFDPGGNLKTAAAIYNYANEDYTPGPLNEQGQSTPENCLNFDRQWSVKKTDIDALLADFTDGTLDNPVPGDLLIWPGKGNPHFFDIFGFALPDTPQGLAPFNDRDGDGIYDPEKGDVPYIKEADQAVWWVFNDGGTIHEVSLGDPLLMEVQVMAYSYDSPDTDISSTTFYDYTFINRAIETLDSFYAALWIDPDLGCFTDDLVGCDPANNLAFIHNKEDFDGGPGCGDCQGVVDFCGDIPMLGIKVLRGTDRVENGQVVNNGMSSFMYYTGDNNFPNPPIGIPNSALDYYTLMTGTWPDGTPLTTGGTGYRLSGGTPTKYAFPGAPNDPNGWSMCSEDIGPQDSRIIIGSGPSSLQPGASTRMSFAVFKAYGNSYPCPGIENLQTVCQKVEEFVSSATSTQDLTALPASAVRFTPNPMKDYGVIRLTEGHQLLDQVAIFSLDGRKLREANGIQAMEWQVEREGLSAGMYLYRLQTTEGKWFSGKMIVQ